MADDGVAIDGTDSLRALAPRVALFEENLDRVRVHIGVLTPGGYASESLDVVVTCASRVEM